MYPTVNGAYTELFAGVSEDVNLEKTGSWSKFTIFYQRSAKHPVNRVSHCSCPLGSVRKHQERPARGIQARRRGRDRHSTKILGMVGGTDQLLCIILKFAFSLHD